MKLGFDFGSKNIHYAVLDGNRLLQTGSREHNGNIRRTFDDIIDSISAKYNISSSDHTIGVTGNIDLPPDRRVDPVVASVEANRYLDTGCRNILSIGCETFSLIRLDENFQYMEHTVNSDCASGTGSFIDQQAKRLGFDTGVLSEKAAAFTGSEPSIATRCAVFAKSDIIHAQALGFSPDAIAAGLCTGVSRSVLANTLKGRDLPGDVVFIGGMSQNTKVAGEISRALKRPVTVHPQSVFFGAIGAALTGRSPFSAHPDIVSVMFKRRDTRQPLVINLPEYPDFSADEMSVRNGIEVTVYEPVSSAGQAVYIGIDVGSTSTKAVVTDKKGRVLSGFYGRTQGDPVDAVTRLFGEIKYLYSKRDIRVCGVATTGSGRELIKELTRADMAVNEITAHARGSVSIDPEVDTIIEIGGQDAKFTLLENGRVTHAAMNYVCAAGTGSFIEEQAKRMVMPLSEISRAVPGREAPFTSDRCTVYMERDLNIFLSEGRTREEIMAAVLYSVRDNYLSKVVGKTAVGKKIYFQGATARNKALVAVFQTSLGKPVNVSRFCHLTGAIGCAMTLVEKGIKETRFAGIDFSCTSESEICRLCSNQCDLRVYTVDGRKTAWGLKCGRDYSDPRAGKKETASKLETAFHEHFSVPDTKPEGEGRPVIGIPQTLFLMEHLSLFKDFFQKLGLKVVVEKSTDKKLKAGMRLINADFCAPMALSHGMAASLAEKPVDFIFLPTLINERNYIRQLPEEERFSEKTTDGYFCYYSSYAGTILGHLPGNAITKKVLHPKIRFNNQPDLAVGRQLANALSEPLRIGKDAIVSAYIDARKRFSERLKQWGEKGRETKKTSPDKPRILLLGRPYAIFDKRINLGIPAHLESMGFDLVSQSMLDLSPTTFQGEMPDHLATMHWYFGQQILIAMETIRNTPDLYPVFLTCFRCSPDAYLMNYFKDAMETIGKPYLVLQLDEHSSDVGYLTRIEAAADTFMDDYAVRRTLPAPVHTRRISCEPDQLNEGDTVILPLVDQRINSLQQSVFQSAGFNAMVAPMSPEMINTGYRYVSGGECLPNVAITGSIIHLFREKGLDPERSVVYLPNLCLSCNLNQYANLIKLACRNANIGNIRVMNTNGLSALPGLPARSNSYLLSVTFLSSILNKLRFRYLPYETVKGATQQAVDESEAIIRWHVENKKSLFNAAQAIKEAFLKLPLPDTRKTRIGILGDMYAKYNALLNDSICDYAQSLGGEILLPSYNELMLHTAHADTVELGANPKLWQTMAGYEEKFERIFEDLLETELFEPPLDVCLNLMESYGFTEFITGETTVSLGRMLYYIEHKVVDAVIHVNPLFCCPGVISSALFRKIQETFQIPVIDLFYDGTNRPNKMIDPHMFYLTKKAG